MQFWKNWKTKIAENFDGTQLELERAARMVALNRVIGRSIRDLSDDVISAAQARRAAEFFRGNQFYHLKNTRYHSPYYAPPEGQELDPKAHIRYMRRYTMALAKFFDQQASTIPVAGMALDKLFSDRDELLPGIWEATPFECEAA